MTIALQILSPATFSEWNQCLRILRPEGTIYMKEEDSFQMDFEGADKSYTTRFFRTVELPVRPMDYSSSSDGYSSYASRTPLHIFTDPEQLKKGFINVDNRNYLDFELTSTFELLQGTQHAPGKPAMASHQIERNHALKLSLNQEMYFNPFPVNCPSLAIQLKLVQI